jgi:hypothetical protein
METCQHCESSAAEIIATRTILERLEQTVLAHIAEMTQTRTIVAGMQKTLLGNGQPGQCEKHGVRIARLEWWRAWITGALAAMGVLWLAAVAIGAAVLESRR